MEEEQKNGFDFEQFIISISIAVALTDGKTVLFDADLKPSLRHRGVVCENRHGEWSVMCVKRFQLRHNGDELAGQVCSSIGFTGYTYHNISRVNGDGVIADRQRGPILNQPLFELDFLHDTHFVRSRRNAMPELRSEAIVATPQRPNCMGLYVECAPHSTIPKDKPPRVIATTTTTPVPGVETTSARNITNNAVTTESVFDITFNETIFTAANFENFSAPWVASILINGEPACVGILVDKYWVIADIKCVNNTKCE